jgi:hypothetical protein
VTTVTAPPDVLRWTSRSGDHGDCVVAAIELGCGVSYEEALKACLAVNDKVLQQGMNWPDTRRAIKALGRGTKVLRAGTLRDRRGDRHPARLRTQAA